MDVRGANVVHALRRSTSTLRKQVNPRVLRIGIVCEGEVLDHSELTSVLYLSGSGASPMPLTS